MPKRGEDEDPGEKEELLVAEELKSIGEKRKIET